MSGAGTPQRHPLATQGRPDVQAIPIGPGTPSPRPIPGPSPAGGSKGGAQVKPAAGGVGKGGAQVQPTAGGGGKGGALAQPTAGGGGQVQPNVYNQASGAYGQALSGTQQAAAGPDIQQFMNPYTQSVTDQTMADLERQRQMQMNTIGAQAGAAGAYGGSRHGVAESLTNEAFARQGAQSLANLNMQGFNTALGAAQAQQGLGLQAAGQMGNLANLGFGFGQQISQQQARQGSQQQAAMQDLINAARGQYAGFTGAPQQSLSLPLAALGASNMGQSTQTTSQQPGLFNYLSLGLGLL